jgi:hypothetical protein
MSIPLPLVRRTGRAKGKLVREANMARQQATFQSLKSIAAAVLAGLGLVILFGMVGESTAQVTNILGFVAKEAMGLLPYVFPVAWRALESYAFEHQGFSPCLLQMLVSCWSLVHGLAATA